MLKIQLQDNFIELPIVDKDGNIVETIIFDKSDTAMDNLDKKYQEVIRLSKDEKSFKTLAQRKAFTKKAIDGTFSEGSFDKLYKLNPSLMIVTAYYLQMCYAVKNIMNNELNEHQELLTKYMEG